ncbi:hypothetical protein C5167_000450 [Papaver somniferum]|uniref:Uncharacterized protein n=1 Tax=Papaver somniferum TaxID=3469 RepID=A0A4Y7KSQ5_PAPSO|nr:hypothetical protein C5167_000450 [Papaver somniferum]
MSQQIITLQAYDLQFFSANFSSSPPVASQLHKFIQIPSIFIVNNINFNFCFKYIPSLSQTTTSSIPSI